MLATLCINDAVAAAWQLTVTMTIVSVISIAIIAGFALCNVGVAIATLFVRRAVRVTAIAGIAIGIGTRFVARVVDAAGSATHCNANLRFAFT